MMTLTLLDLVAIALVVTAVDLAIVYAIVRKAKEAIGDMPMLSGMFGGN